MTNAANFYPWRYRILLSLSFLFFFSSHMHAQRELVLRFYDGTPQDTIDAMLDEFNATELAITPISFIRLWRLDSIFIDPNTHESIFLIGSDTLGIQQSGKKARNKTSMQSADVNYYVYKPDDYDPGLSTCNEPLEFPDAMDCTVKVAVIDTGVEEDHVDLQGWLWENPIEAPPGINHQDDDSNQYIDDIIGYDFYNDTSAPIDSQSHGTHITGIIKQIAEEHNGTSINIMSLKGLNKDGEGTTFSSIEAIDYAISQNAQIINISLGYKASKPDPSSGPGYNKPAPMEYAIELAGQMNNILVVCSAGNNRVDIDVSEMGYYPAGFDSDNLIVVAAGHCDTTLLSFSNFGHTSVDLATEGIVYSTILNNQWDIKAGTSMAAAIVSGTAALLGTYNCNFEYASIKNAILNSVSPAGLPVHTNGFLNGHAALNYFLNGGPPQNRSPYLLTEELTVSPNPFMDHLFLEWEEQEEGQAVLEIYNSTGQLIKSKKVPTQIGKNQTTITLKKASIAGIYSLLLKTTNGKWISKSILRQSDQ